MKENKYKCELGYKTYYHKISLVGTCLWKPLRYPYHILNKIAC